VSLHAPPALPREACALLEQLVHIHLLTSGSVANFLAKRQDWLDQYTTSEKMGQALIQAGLLTHYQLDRVLSGDLHGLVLGQYRILKKLGQGGMGTVYLGEHSLMKRRAAIKVLPVDEDCHPDLRERFYAEMRGLAELSHANIVQAFDAGELAHTPGGLPGFIYLVMEMIDGGDLDHLVARNGPCSIPEACSYIRQAACGLQAAHDRHLIHRDIKPSNILLTRFGQAKLVDFGLARRFSSKLTDPRALLGSLEFMAPEQSHDPSAVGKEADVYGLGATLFWLLTGETPYPSSRHVGPALRMLQTQQPRHLRDLAPDAPPALDALMDRLLDRDPTRRPAQPFNVMNALTPFLIDESGVCLLSPAPKYGEAILLSAAPDRRPGRRILIVDDEAGVRSLLHAVLMEEGCECEEAGDGEEALALATGLNFDLVLLDLNLPGMDGYEVCRRLRTMPNHSYMKILVVSGMGDQDALSNTLPAGADDYIVKPFKNRQLLAKVEHALHLKDAQERSALLAEQLLLTNRQLEQSLKAREDDVRQAHNALLYAMARMAESREGETAGHLRRLQAYTRALARQAATTPPWAGLVDDRFLRQLERCVVLHDIGNLGLPEDVLRKPGALNTAERALVQTHPLIGDQLLESLGREHGTSLDFLGMARDIVRHHHERFDGRGYPDRLAGDAIPASARLTAVADVYDALRRERLHKRAMPHNAAIRLMRLRSEGQFDPTLLEALDVCHDEFEQIYDAIGD
jgi:putative two-component system response regulator